MKSILPTIKRLSLESRSAQSILLTSIQPASNQFSPHQSIKYHSSSSLQEPSPLTKFSVSLSLQISIKMQAPYTNLSASIHQPASISQHPSVRFQQSVSSISNRSTSQHLLLSIYFSASSTKFYKSQSSSHESISQHLSQDSTK